jgi:D-arabinose 1-dehydrogenase-like Zn-dependent alcohol dehydrogenase
MVRVLACSVCRTGLHIIKVDLPSHWASVVPGHYAAVQALRDGTVNGAGVIVP